jgi:DNA polymerase-4
MPLRSLFVDFNSYFASVEQQIHPYLRNRPVAVVPMLADNTSCIAASYEAKYYGVKTGTRVCEARRLCPDLQIIESHPQIYVEYHHRLIEAVHACVPVREVLSIDEMTCDLTGSMMRRERNVQIAREIKAKIARDVGVHLRCSIGIAPNTFLAKTATELEKPDGLVVIETEDLPGCLYGLELRELCGIGPRMERRLYLHGIVTVCQLCAASMSRLRSVWGGVEGERMYSNLRAEVVLRPPTHPPTLSQSQILPPHQRNTKHARATH